MRFGVRPQRVIGAGADCFAAWAALSLHASFDEPAGLITARCAHAAGHRRDGSPWVAVRRLAGSRSGSARLRSTASMGRRHSPHLNRCSRTTAARSTSRVAALRGCKMYECTHKRAFGTFAAPFDLALRGHARELLRRIRDVGSAALCLRSGPQTKGDNRDPAPSCRLWKTRVQRLSIPSSIERAMSLAPSMPRPFAIPSALKPRPSL